MPLSSPAPREQRHIRTIDCQGFLREDGLWDIEAHLVDTKAYSHDNHWRGRLEPGDPVHEMWMRLTVDDGYEIRAVETVTDHHPFPICPDITPNFQRLAGLSITKGFSRNVKNLLGGTQGCTHLLHLLQVMATVAFQTIRPKPKDGRDATDLPPETGHRPPILNTCHAWADDGDAVQRWFPKFYTGQEKTG